MIVSLRPEVEPKEETAKEWGPSQEGAGAKKRPAAGDLSRASALHYDLGYAETIEAICRVGVLEAGLRTGALELRAFTENILHSAFHLEPVPGIVRKTRVDVRAAVPSSLFDDKSIAAATTTLYHFYRSLRHRRPDPAAVVFSTAIVFTARHALQPRPR